MGCNALRGFAHHAAGLVVATQLPIQGQPVPAAAPPSLQHCCLCCLEADTRHKAAAAARMQLLQHSLMQPCSNAAPCTGICCLGCQCGALALLLLSCTAPSASSAACSTWGELEMHGAAQDLMDVMPLLAHAPAVRVLQPTLPSVHQSPPGMNLEEQLRS